MSSLRSRASPAGPVPTVVLVLCLGIGFGMASPAPAAERPVWQVSGDLRGVYSADWRDTRAGGTAEGDVWQSRFRMRLRREWSGGWSVQTRLAATAASEGNDFDLYLRTARQGGTGVTPGTATLDEAFAEYRSGAWRLRAGRLQTKISLPLITDKSLDRKEASNVNIGWTDGVELRVPIVEGWEGLLIAQYNGPRGNGQPTRGPIGFGESSSRVGAFAGLRATVPAGPVFQRVLGLTWYPDSLAPAGLSDPARNDYVTATVKLAAGWAVGHRLGLPGARLVVAGELGHAFNRPERGVMGLPGEGQAGGTAWHLGADLAEIRPGHTVGASWGRLPAGWLISNDFRPNEELAELRYVWRLSPAWQFDLRGRWRRERDRLEGAAFLQRDRDLRTRLTWYF